MARIFFKQDIVGSYLSSYIENAVYHTYDMLYVVDLPFGTGRDVKFGMICRYGNMDNVLLAMQRGANGWDWGLYYSCMYGHLHIVEMMLQRAHRLSFGLIGACRGGQTALVDLMIRCGSRDWNEGLGGACFGGQRDIAEMMIRNGAKDLRLGLYWACLGKHQQIAEWMISLGAPYCHYCNNKNQPQLKRETNL